MWLHRCEYMGEQVVFTDVKELVCTDIDRQEQLIFLPYFFKEGGGAKGEGESLEPTPR